MEVSFCIDWISCTFKGGEVNEFLSKINNTQNLQGVETSPVKGYTHAIEYWHGLRVNWHEALDAQGIHMVFSGSCLRAMQSQGLDGGKIIDLIHSYGGKTSRIDLAIDIRESGLKREEFCAENLKPYKGKGNTPKHSDWFSDDGGWTHYVGSRTSDKHLRIYDKAKEQKDYVGDYIRIELECKGRLAKALLSQLAEKSTDERMGLASVLIRTVADYNLGAWNAALACKDVGFALPNKTDSDTMGWLLTVAAKSLAKQMLKHEERSIIDDFWQAVQIEFAALQAKQEN